MEIKYYKVKVVSLIEDPDSGKIKKQNDNYLVEAKGASDAEKITVEYIKEHAMFSYDFDIPSIKEEKLEDIILLKDGE